MIKKKEGRDRRVRLASTLNIRTNTSSRAQGNVSKILIIESYTNRMTQMDILVRILEHTRFLVS